MGPALLCGGIESRETGNVADDGFRPKAVIQKFQIGSLRLLITRQRTRSNAAARLDWELGLGPHMKSAHAASP